MIPFRTENGAVFRCRVEPTWTSYANLNFHMDDDVTIPFHLSLRLTEGTVAVNRKDYKGWGRERHIAVPFPTHGFQVEVAFSGNGVAIQVNGVEIGRFTAEARFDVKARYLLRRDFPDLRKITRCSADGAVPRETIKTFDRTFDRLWSAVNRKVGLVLTDRMELAERLPDDLTTARHAVYLPGDNAPLLLRPATKAVDVMADTFVLPKGIAAVLIPGRIWVGIGAGQSAILRIQDLKTGLDLAAHSVSRQDVERRILRLSRDGSLTHDDLAALQAIEHVRHGGLWDQLDAATQSHVKSAAARLGLVTFLNAPQDDPATPPLQDNQAGLAALSLEQIKTDLSDLLITRPGPAQLADWLQRTLAQFPQVDNEHLALALCPTFCEQGAFDSLFSEIKSRGLPEIRPWDDVGYVSLTLPFLLLDGHFDQVINRMNWLVTRHGGWLVTSVLGWIAQALTHPGTMPMPEDKRHSILSAFCAVVAAQAEDPWGRAACHCLMDGLLSLLARLPHLPPSLREQVSATAMSAYGLSPRFWARLSDNVTDDGLSTFSPDLFVARNSFDILRAPGTPDQTQSALATLAGLKCQGLLAAALHLVAPEEIRGTGLWHDELALRGLFAPGTPEDPGLDIRGTIARTLHENGRVQVASGYDWLERRLGAAAFDLLSNWQSMSVPRRMVALDGCLADAHTLSGKESGHIGLAICLSLLRPLQDDPTARDRIQSHLRQIRHSFGPFDAATCKQMPALHGALEALWSSPRVYADACDALGLDLPPPKAGWPQDAGHLPDPATSLFGTVVVVMSCHPNLQTRIPAMRKSWLCDLERFGIPYIVVVGAGAPAPADRNIVQLDAPDDYEGLPQKTLAALAYANTQFPGCRVLKIDDDCFLDVAEYFFSLSFLKADYYGRPLARARGQMDRTWHMEKSTSLRGRNELDKSPEPSTYADGGSGYLLSPRAIITLLRAANTAEGERLIQASFMEDKLVGDLLSLAGIGVSGQDYRVHILRRSRPGGHLVPKWENICLPFAGSGVKLAHLDGFDMQAEAARIAKSPRPARGKIWSTLVPARLGEQSHALDLVSAPACLEGARAAAVSVVATMRNELAMLPHFLAHYRGLGVQSFLIADNGSDDGTLEYLAEQPDIALFTVDSDYRQSHYGVQWQQALMAAYRPAKWSLVADADELLVWTADTKGSLPELLGEADFSPYDAVRIFMLDMYPEGPLSQTDFSAHRPFEAAPFTDRNPFRANSLGRGPFSDSRTWTSATRHRLIPGSRPELFVAQKSALLRYQPWMRLSDGLHYVAETKLAPRSLLFGHFKYTAAFRAKAIAEVARGQHFNNAEEYRKYLDLLSEGRETLFDTEVSVRWTDNHFVQSILTTGRTPNDP
ncbi:MAG: glycosyltransferase family 2 protein [Paracoccaceae bacterium]